MDNTTDNAARARGVGPARLIYGPIEDPLRHRFVVRAAQGAEDSWLAADGPRSFWGDETPTGPMTELRDRRRIEGCLTGARALRIVQVLVAPPSSCSSHAACTMGSVAEVDTPKQCALARLERTPAFSLIA
jgi:hypothetical protein